MATLEANRTAKAARLADVLRAHGATVEQARRMPLAGWSMVAELAGTKPPSVQTQQCVIALLAHGATS